MFFVLGFFFFFALFIYLFIFLTSGKFCVSPLRCKSLKYWTTGRKKPRKALWSPSHDSLPGDLHKDVLKMMSDLKSIRNVAYAFLSVNLGITHVF